MRLIDADALMHDIEKYNLSDGKFQHWVEVQPTIEERNTGKWIRIISYSDCATYVGVKCSQCGYSKSYGHVNFCPNCGADMRGDK